MSEGAKERERERGSEESVTARPGMMSVSTTVSFAKPCVDLLFMRRCLVEQRFGSASCLLCRTKALDPLKWREGGNGGQTDTRRKNDQDRG